jgi:hypothetical protein
MADDVKGRVTNKERVAAFLHDLTLLSKKHQMVIWGCGCCGSPNLSDERDEQIATGLGWDRGTQSYDASLTHKAEIEDRD